MENDTGIMTPRSQEEENALMIIAGVIQGTGPLIHSFGEAMDKGDYHKAHEVATTLCTYIDKVLPGIQESAAGSGTAKPALDELAGGLEELHAGGADIIAWIDEYTALKKKVKPIAEKVCSATDHINKSVSLARDATGSAPQ